jgi:hypothetical protein
MKRSGSPPDRLGVVARPLAGPRSAVAAGMVLALLLPALSFASAWRFEAEDAPPDRWTNVGGDPITVVSCGAASGGRALEGLDETGDWVEFDFNLPAGAVLTDSIRCASPDQTSWQFLVEFYAEGSDDPVASNQHAKVTGRGIT